MRLAVREFPNMARAGAVVINDLDHTTPNGYPVYYVYDFEHPLSPQERADILINLVNGMPPSGIIADWLEERGHAQAAEDLRRNF